MTLTALLREMALSSPQPDTLAQFYRDALGYVLTPDEKGILGIGRRRRLRFVYGAPKRIDYSAYATSRADIDALRARLRAAGAAFEDIDWPGFYPIVLRFADPSGNTLMFGEALPEAEVTDPLACRSARLQHVVYASPTPQKLIDFYVSIVGFQLSDQVLDDQGQLRAAFMRCSAEHHSLAVFWAATDRSDHHCYEADEWNHLRDWADHMAQFHIPLKWGPGRHGPGNNLFLFVHDLDGNWVEISAELELVEADRPTGTWEHCARTLDYWGSPLARP